MISRAILSYKRGRTSGLADGIVIMPSHNATVLLEASEILWQR